MDVKLPKLGEGADSGVVVNVFVKEGDTVARDQAILELENEKAVASIPAPAAGTVTGVFVKPGDKVSVGQRLIALGDGGAGAAPQGRLAASSPAGCCGWPRGHSRAPSEDWERPGPRPAEALSACQAGR